MFPESALQKIAHLREIGLLVGIKVESEAEGMGSLSIARLHVLASKAGVPLILKIGGCEAVADLRAARDLGIEEIVAPMIESAFAVHKFKSALASVYPSGMQPLARILIESDQGVKNLSSILDASLGFATGINVGRSDLKESLRLRAGFVDDGSAEVVDGHVMEIIRQASDLGFETTVGGKVTASSIASLLTSGRHPSRFETRRLVFASNKLVSDPSLIEELHAVELQIAQALAWTAVKDGQQLHNAVEELRARFNIPKEPTDII